MALVESRGWRPSNFGEARVAQTLHSFGIRPAAPGAKPPVRHADDAVFQQWLPGNRYRIDFAWPSIKVGLEADGWVHTSEAVMVKDGRRDAWLREQGWIIFRVSVEQGSDSLADALVRVVRFVRGELDAR